MKSLVETADQKTERVFLVGLELKQPKADAAHGLGHGIGGNGHASANGNGHVRWRMEEQLDELAELARTAGAFVVGRGSQKLDARVAGTFIGTGKAAEWAKECKEQQVDTVIFDDELSGAQARNLEKIFECKVLDRTSLILDIFAQRARTKEGKLQVELAQLEHLLPRLTRYWTHLSRQKGGIGMRGGEGETQLEADRRKVQERIDRIKEELELVQRQRETQRQGRQRSLWPLASIVGYTNAGKSTLLNALTGAAVLVENKLFATLDPTTRRLRLPTNQNVLLSDTVGFIRKLPHGLVEAFKATLEEVAHADLLIHVVDISNDHPEEQIKSVEEVLREIGAGDKPTLMVFNKVDRTANPEVVNGYLQSNCRSVAVSAKTGQGITDLLAELGAALRPIREFVELSVPHTESAAISRLHQVAQVVERDYEGDNARFKARIPPHYHSEFAPFIVKEIS